MKQSSIYRFQTQRILDAAQAAGDEEAVRIAGFLLADLPCSDAQVASYASQIRRECSDQAVAILAADLATATVPGNPTWLRLGDEARAAMASV